MEIALNFKKCIDKGDLVNLKKLLNISPQLANQYIHFGSKNKSAVHPMHYVSYAVFEYKIVEILAVEMIKFLLEAGAYPNGKTIEGRDTPLIAAISLYCDQVASYLLSLKDIDIMHKGTHGGIALHWAAWTGSSLLTQMLIEREAPLNQIDIDFGATPLHWAINGMSNTSTRNQRNQLIVIKLLLENGANPLISDKENKTVYEIASRNNLPKVSNLLTNF